jgi:ABC-type branched-subunit amino acid transport system substrate-binding protein
MIKIGAVVATGGPVALLGNSFLKAIQLAKEDLKSTTNQYEFVIEEILSPDQSEPAIERLIKIHNVNALVVGLSMSGQIAKAHATATKIPLFCICSVSSVGDELYTFTIMPLAEDEAIQWADEARKRRIKRIARLTQDYPSIDNHVRAFEGGDSEGRNRIRLRRQVPSNNDGFPIADRGRPGELSRRVFCRGVQPSLDILGQQLMDARIRSLASVVAFSVSERPELFEGGWYTDSYVSPEFKARLDQKYPASRFATHMMPYAYDSFKMLVQAFESGQDVLSYVRNMTEYSGTAGKITKQSGTGNFRSSPAVWVIKNGKPTLAHPI